MIRVTKEDKVMSTVPTELPFKEAVRIYADRARLILRVTLAAASAALLVLGARWLLQHFPALTMNGSWLFGLFLIALLLVLSVLFSGVKDPNQVSMRTDPTPSQILLRGCFRVLFVAIGILLALGGVVMLKALLR